MVLAILHYIYRLTGRSYTRLRSYRREAEERRPILSVVVEIFFTKPFRMTSTNRVRGLKQKTFRKFKTVRRFQSLAGWSVLTARRSTVPGRGNKSYHFCIGGAKLKIIMKNFFEEPLSCRYIGHSGIPTAHNVRRRKCCCLGSPAVIVLALVSPSATAFASACRSRRSHSGII